ncbi:Scr1 family TA system antitoxin-like transcriptional regulator [Salinispora tropica]|uniref:Scr1 family TA system antitoxin-like transcriptional regulator n=1 Tax=Salinispora tropica TaxID=168695 RepID=UPI003B75BC7C
MAAEIQSRVAARLARQQRLTSDNSPQVVAVVDDSALRRPIGGAATFGSSLQRVRFA